MSVPRFDALNRAALARGWEPLCGIAWDEPDHAVDPTDERWTAMFPDPLFTTAWCASLPPERRNRLGLAVGCSYLARGIAFERGLQAGLLAYIDRDDLVPGEHEFLHHEIIEESRHTQMFLRFLQASTAGWDDGAAPAFDQVPGQTMEFERLVSWGRNDPAALFLACLIGEDALDVAQRDYLRQDADAQHPLVRDVFRLHVNDEARHLIYARAALQRHLQPERRRQLQIAVPQMIRAWVQEFLTTPVILCDSFEIPPAVFREAGYRAEHAAVARRLLGRLERFLGSLGLLPQEDLWVRAMRTETS